MLPTLYSYRYFTHIITHTHTCMHTHTHRTHTYARTHTHIHANTSTHNPHTLYSAVDFLSLLMNFVHYNAAYLDEEVLIGLVQ